LEEDVHPMEADESLNQRLSQDSYGRKILPPSTTALLRGCSSHTECRGSGRETRNLAFRPFRLEGHTSRAVRRSKSQPTQGLKRGARPETARLVG
jgi:hypothetical protein